MFETVLKVQFVSFKNSFVYLSPSHKSLHTGAIIKLQHDIKEAYFSANIIRNIVQDDSIGINPSYAKLLDIAENELVNVSQIEHLPVVNSIAITPVSTADYNILEIFAENIQSNLLDQVRVVNVKQKLMIWIGRNLSVSVLVENVQPVAPGSLDFLTEVVVKMPSTSTGNRSNNDRKSKPNKSFTDFLFKPPSLVKDTISDRLDKSLQLIQLCCRLLPLSKLPGKIQKSRQLHPFMAFVHRSTFRERIFPYMKTSDFFSLTPLGASFPERKIYVKLCHSEDYFVTLDRASNTLIDIFVDDNLLTFYKCGFGVKAMLREISPLSKTREIEIHCKADSSINVVEKVKIYLSRYCDPTLIWNPVFPLEIAENLYCSFKFLPEGQDYCVIDEQFLRNCSYTLVEGVVLKILPSKQPQLKITTEFLPLKNSRDKILDVLSTHQRSCNIIVTGRGGIGKTSLLKHLANAASNPPHFLSTELLHCKAIKGKTTDSLHKYFTDALTGIIASQPSVLLLDDLDVLCEKFDGEETPNSVYATRVSEMLFSLFRTLTDQNLIKIVATVESVSKLNEQIYRSRGNHLFKHVFPIAEMSKTDRKSILEWYLTQHKTEDCIDYDELSLKTDGFVIKDIAKFYEKVLFRASKESSNYWQELVIRQEHCDAVLSKSCALSLQNIKFHSPGDKSFQDIGGMDDLKRALMESLLWPVKYPTVFANSPIKLQSGFLLYGAPGTGKTLLAGATAKQCNLKFISVKGPELLSKYIGGSEQAVRDVFEKAQRAKPCILFFDEFDSLARRRGHDNTGVTDRVVNQFLTELDGIETLTGVYVLAATSRPDLLDPALLRPGRLDRQLLCPMPNEKDRLEILQILSRHLDTCDDVDLRRIASETDGFSGADLKSLLFTAQMSSVDTSKDYSQVESLEISQDLLSRALHQTRPSITKSERAKFERIYAQFEGGNLEDFKVDSVVTLA